MNDWMDTHEFLDQVKVKRFCLNLVGEARLHYKSQRLINTNWDINGCFSFCLISYNLTIFSKTEQYFLL